MFLTHCSAEWCISQISVNTATTNRKTSLIPIHSTWLFTNLPTFKTILNKIYCYRCSSSKLSVKDELLDMVALKETTRGIDIEDAFDKVLTKALV